MSNTALITGASNGIGLELARLHAQKGGDLVLVARSENKLNQLKDELEQNYNVKAHVLALDLTEDNAAQQVFEQTEQAGLTIDILINNAGFGGHGKFHERQFEQDHSMMQLNMVALTLLTHLYMQDMVKRNKGQILNVSSTASFMPGPLQAVYYATKAFVTSFSQAIAEELSDTNVTVTALCPGAVATGFVKAGDLEGLDAWDKAATAESVAKVGYKAMEKGQLVAINEKALQFLINWIIPLLPRKTVLKLSRQFMEK